VSRAAPRSPRSTRSSSFRRWSTATSRSRSPLAIFDHLDRKAPSPPLFPTDAAGRARVWSLCLYVACEIQPLQNLRTERYLDRELHLDAAARTAFKRHFQDQGFDVVERMLADGAGRFGHGDAPTAVDCLLVPQAAAVVRTGGDLGRWPTIARGGGGVRRAPGLRGGRRRRTSRRPT
jgi:maleylacetoacetate isomerase